MTVLLLRDAIVSFGAGYGVLLIPIERRIAQYLRPERLYAVGGRDGCDDDHQNPTTNTSRICYSLDSAACAWVTEVPMITERGDHCLAMVRGDLWTSIGIVVIVHGWR